MGCPIVFGNDSHLGIVIVKAMWLQSQPVNVDNVYHPETPHTPTHHPTLPLGRWVVGVVVYASFEIGSGNGRGVLCRAPQTHSHSKRVSALYAALTL